LLNRFLVIVCKGKCGGGGKPALYLLWFVVFVMGFLPVRGQTWELTNLSESGAIDALGTNGSTLWAAKRDFVGSGMVYPIYRSTNNGASWNVVSTNLFTSNGFEFEFNATSVFAVEFNRVWRSTNNGASWTQLQMPPQAQSRIAPPTARTGGTTSYGSALAVNGSTLFYASVNSGVCRSLNNGDTWSRIEQGLPHFMIGNTQVLSEQVTDIEVLGTTLLLSTRGGLYRSTDNGASWGIVGVGIASDVLSLYAIDANIVLAYTYSGKILRSSDSGVSWEEVGRFFSSNNGTITGAGNGRIFIGTAGSGIKYSTDNGVSWLNIQGGWTYISSVWGFAANTTTLFAATNSGRGTMVVYRMDGISALPSTTPTGVIRGTIQNGANATVALTGTTTRTTTASATGVYSFNNLPNGVYTVTPTLTDFIFTPTSASVGISGSNQNGIDFTARAGAPAAPVGNFTFTVSALPLGSTTLTLSWTPPVGGAAGYTIVLEESSTPPTGTPQVGDVFFGDAAFNGMTRPPFSGQVVYDGTGTSVVVTGLTPNTRYSAVAYPYNGSGGARSYFVPTPATASAQMLDIAAPPVNVSVGSITLVPATLNFGDVPRGTSYTRTYSLSYVNLTTASITLTPPMQWELSVGGAAFSATPIVWSTLANVGQVSVRARFTPFAHGVFTSTIEHRAGSTSAIVRVNASSTPPSITVSTLTLDFGAVAPSSTATKAYRVSYRNLITRTITLTPPAGFVLSTTTAGTFTNLPLTVSTRVTGSFNVYVQFVPTALGKQTGMVQNENPDATSIALFVEGEGVYSTVALSRSALDFDAVPVGTCKTLTYTITPAGGVSRQLTELCPPASGNVQISTAEPNGPFSPACRTVSFARVGGLRSVQVWVRYCPTNNADLNEIITHTTDPGGLVENLSVSGFGAEPEIIVSPATFNFGTNPLNSVDEIPLTVQVRNLTAPATITLSTTASNQAFTFLDNSTGQWNSTWTTTANVTAATYRVQARFIPTAQQTYRTTFAAVCVAQNGTTTDTFTLLGTGRGAALIITTGTLNFNGTFLLTPSTKSYVLRYDNITTATLDISPTNHPAFLLSNAQNGVFTTTAGLTYTVGGTAANPVSGNVTAWVRFLPDRAGTTTATLFHNSFVSVGTTGANVKTLSLSGQGLAPFIAVTTATNQGTSRFNDVPFGEQRFYEYTLAYRNITAGTIEVGIPAGSAFAVTTATGIATGATATWIGANQTFRITPPVLGTTATTAIKLWVRFTASVAGMTRSTIAHVSVSGDVRTDARDELLCLGESLPLQLAVSPRVINFGNVEIGNGSSRVVSVTHASLTSDVTITPQPGFVLAIRGANATFGLPFFVSTATVISIAVNGGITNPLPQAFNISIVAVPRNLGLTTATIRITSGTLSTSVTVSAIGIIPPNRNCLGITPNDKYFAHIFANGIDATPGATFLTNWSNSPAQWHLCNPLNPATSIQATKAWAIFQGSTTNIIGICDTGVLPTHPDFGNKVLPDGALPYDPHGTQVASIAAACGNNTEGMSGVDWLARIRGFSQSLTEPIEFNRDVDTNLRVSNHSYFNLNDRFVNGQLISGYALGQRRDVTRAYRRGMVTVTTTGNWYTDFNARKINAHGNAVLYPGGYTHGILTVGSTKQDGTRYSESQTGSHIDLVAPSVGLFIATVDGEGFQDPALLYNDVESRNYVYSSFGTSYAAPQVAGVASLLIGYTRDIQNSYLANDDVEWLLKLSADKVTGLDPDATRYGNYTYDNRGWNEAVGYGRLNAYRALWYIREGNLRQLNTRITTSANIFLPAISLTPSTTNAFVLKVDLMSSSTGNLQQTVSGDFLVLKYEVRQTVNFPAVGLSGRTSVWGRGFAMFQSGLAEEEFSDEYAFFDEATMQWNSLLTPVHSGIGWCEALQGSVTDNQATLKTFIYQVIDPRSGLPTGRWFPCNPDNVVFHYSVLSRPNEPPAIPPSLAQQIIKQFGEVHSENISNNLVEKIFSYPESVVLYAPKPNPAQHTTTIAYELPQSSTIQIDILDLYGNTALHIQNSKQDAGRYEIPIQLHSLSSGLYRIRLYAVGSQNISMKTVPITVIK
jgi:hypothetical protein